MFFGLSKFDKDISYKIPTIICKRVNVLFKRTSF